MVRTKTRPPDEKGEARLLKVRSNTYDSLLFVKSQLEPRLKRVISFDDVISYLVGMWSKRHDRGKKR